jgi:hypothetical protein
VSASFREVLGHSHPRYVDCSDRPLVALTATEVYL